MINEKQRYIVQCNGCGNKQKYNGKYKGIRECVYCGKKFKVDNLSIIGIW